MNLYLLLSCRCYLHSGDIDNGHKVFEDYICSEKFPPAELYAVSKIKILEVAYKYVLCTFCARTM